MLLHLESPGLPERTLLLAWALDWTSAFLVLTMHPRTCLYRNRRLLKYGAYLSHSCLACSRRVLSGAAGRRLRHAQTADCRDNRRILRAQDLKQISCGRLRGSRL